MANEWPGPPLRTTMRNGPLSSNAGAAADQSVDDAQTDPGPPRPRPAAEKPRRMGAGASTPPEAGAGPDENSAVAAPQASAAGPNETGPAGPTRPDQPEPAQQARETRRGRSRRPAADVPAEPDAADEWINLLTADPADE